MLTNHSKLVKHGLEDELVRKGFFEGRTHHIPVVFHTGTDEEEFLLLLPYLLLPNNTKTVRNQIRSAFEATKNRSTCYLH